MPTNEFSPNDDWSSLVFIRVLPDLCADPVRDADAHIPIGYVLVIEPEKHDPKYKLAGGHKSATYAETPIETAIREALGETGLPIREANITEVEAARRWFDTHRTPHWSFLFVASVRESDLEYLGDADAENEGEQPAYFTVSNFWEMVQGGEMLGYHYTRLVEHGLILPLDRDQHAA